MATPTLLPLLLAGLLCLVIGAALAWLYLQWRGQRDGLSRSEIERDFVRREVHERLQQEADLHYENLQEKATTELALQRRLATLETEHRLLGERLDNQASEVERLQAVSVAQFEQTAERLFREKSQYLKTENVEQLSGLLTPLRERIQGFEQQIERRFLEETKDRVTLREEIRHLHRLNQQISTEANNLAGALRGNTKTQGDWGEWQLLTLLEASGLERDVHFRAQPSFADEDGRQKRPDFIINLPDGKHLVIDSKVSLVAYDRYCSCAPEAQQLRDRAAADHLQSLRRHVSDLAAKNYIRLYQINSPDYLLLFVPIEPAFGLALTTDQGLFLEALERNIVIVTPSTLLATLRTVSYIWKQENQKKNVVEIARQSGLLYDRFVAFTEDLKRVGHRLDQAQVSYGAALNKLSTGGKYGSTLIGRAERLRKLGARAKKRLAVDLLEEE